MKRIAAFTLLEMMIGMLISGLVVAAAFSAFRIVASQHKRYKMRHADLSQVANFRQALAHDFFRADSLLTGEANTIRIFGKQVVEYHFSEKFVLRDDGQVRDTFFVSSTSMRINQQTAEASKPHVLLHALEMQLVFGSSRLPFRLLKKYPSAIYLRYSQEQ
jgi:prepilin-type N-terminal cleavage/methylation domain-containing protein